MRLCAGDNEDRHCFNNNKHGEIIFAKIMSYVTMGRGLTTVGDSCVFSFDFLTDLEVRQVSLISCQVSVLANEFGWGVDSNLWSERTIYFTQNIDTDGLQWA